MKESTAAQSHTTQRAVSASQIDLRAYAFKLHSAGDVNFFDHYRKEIIGWLREEKVEEAKVWTYEKGEIILFAIQSTPVDPPWNGVPGITDFMTEATFDPVELHLTSRPDLGFSLP